MAEGLALAASIIAVVELTDRVVSLCSEFLGKVIGAEREIREMITTVTALKGFLEFLDTFAKGPENEQRLPQLGGLCRPQGPLDMCITLLTEMEKKLRPPKRDYNGVLKTVTWPWKWKDIAETLAVIEKQKTLIMLAIQGDTTQLTLNIENTVNDLNHHVRDQSRTDIHRWLAKTDPKSNHIAACSKHEPGTGEWFISSHEFSYWLLPGRSLWLHGKPGAGKTVLCSTIIENVKMRCSEKSVCLYYYFDFNDSQKQTATNMLYSLLSQLSDSAIPLEVQHLFDNSQKGTQQLTVIQLVNALLSISQQRESTYIILDALDESRSLKELLQTLQTIMGSGSKVNLLMTSRPEYEINDMLKGSIDVGMAIEDERVNTDINTHVQQCLQNDPKLSRWSDDLKSTIATSLTAGAQGM
jgi:hypothetical protein